MLVARLSVNFFNIVFFCNFAGNCYILNRFAGFVMYILCFLRMLYMPCRLCVFLNLYPKSIYHETCVLLHCCGDVVACVSSR